MTTEGKLAPIVLSAQDQQQLATALGGPEKFWMLEELEFLAQSGCPAGELENWLENSWSQHNMAYRTIRTRHGHLGRVLWPLPIILASEWIRGGHVLMLPQRCFCYREFWCS